MSSNTPGVGLERGALGLPTVLMQSVAQIAPAVGVLATIAFNTDLAGLGAPSTYLVAFLIAVVSAIALGQLAKHLPSAGGFYTYVSATVGPEAGFVVGWLYSWFVAAIPGALAAYTGFVLHGELDDQYGVNIPWWVFSVAILGLVAYVGFRGIRISGRALMIFSIIEMAIILALAVSGLVSPGDGGLSVAGFNPANSTNLNGFYLAVVFRIFAFTGWESAAAVAEETRDPRRAIPRALVGSVVVLGIFYVFCGWGLQVGWGVDHLDTLAASSENPAFVVAHRLWGGAWILVLLALLNSGIAVCIACTTDSTRNWYAMARSGAFPSRLGHIHPVYRTPVNAVFAQTALALAVCVGVGAWVGPGPVVLRDGPGRHADLRARLLPRQPRRGAVLPRPAGLQCVPARRAPGDLDHLALLGRLQVAESAARRAGPLRADRRRPLDRLRHPDARAAAPQRRRPLEDALPGDPGGGG